MIWVIDISAQLGLLVLDGLYMFRSKPNSIVQRAVQT